MRGHRKLLVTVGAVLLTAAACGGDDSSAAHRSSTSSTSTTTSTTSTTTTEAPKPWVPVTGAPFDLSLPPGWHYQVLAGSYSGVGAKLFPTDATTAAFAEGVAGIIAVHNPRLMAAADGPGPTSSATQPSMVGLEVGQATVGLDAAVRLYKDSLEVGAGQLSEGRLQGRGGEVAWLAYAADPSFKQVSYLVVRGGQLWKLTYVTFGDFDPEKPTADKIATSFLPHA